MLHKQALQEIRNRLQRPLYLSNPGSAGPEDWRDFAEQAHEDRAALLCHIEALENVLDNIATNIEQTSGQAPLHVQRYTMATAAQIARVALSASQDAPHA